MNRMGLQGIRVVLGVSLLCLGASGAWADDSVKADIEVLKDRLAKLEAQQAGAEPGNAVIQLPSGFSGVQMSGFVDTTYTYNFNVPQTNVNTLRVFDTRANSFMFNNAELVVDKPVSAESPVGFKTALMFGTDSEVVGGVTTGLGANAHTHGQAGETAVSDELEVQQAYAEYLAPLGNGVDLKAGKYTTLVGAEVTESKDNWNISRSYMFGFAEPVTHTGLRASYPWTEQLSTTIGVNNGWDLVDDTNQAKGVELGFSAAPMEGVSLAGTYLLGGEQAGNNGNGRHFFNLVAGYQPIDPLQLKLSYDYGWEDDVQGFGDNAVWQGLTGYARYAVTDRFAVALRGELFNDTDGVRTAFTGGINGVTGQRLNLMEWTLTGEYKLHEHLIARAEYRHDWASEHVFRARDLRQWDHQDTVALEFITPF